MATPSTLTASNGTLGTPMTLTINAASTAYTHSLRFDCGTASVAVFTKITATTYQWMPPINLAKQNTTGDTVSITLTLYTFNGDKEIGRTYKTITCTIPDTVVPSVSFTVNDTTGAFDTYGKLVQNISKLEFAVSVTPVQGESLVLCEIVVGAKRYTGTSVTSNVITNTPTVPYTVTVKDSRGRIQQFIGSYEVYEYEPIRVSKLYVDRVNYGTVYDGLTYYFDIDAYGLHDADGNAQNIYYYEIKGKTRDATEYTICDSGSITGEEPPEDSDVSSTWPSLVVYKTISQFFTEYAFYEFYLTITDNFGTHHVYRTTNAPSHLWSIHSSKNGFAFGKTASREAALESAWPIYDRYDTEICNGMAVYTGGGDSGIDPDTTTEELCLTSHTNAPQGLGTFYYIHTVFYNAKSTTAARTQYALPYNKAGTIYWRYYTAADGWSAWERAINASEILDLVYPVGAYYISHNDTSPASLFGGTWHRIESRFLWACPSTSTLGLTAGEMTHTLTIDEMPAHNHKMLYYHSTGTTDYAFGYDYTNGKGLISKDYDLNTTGMDTTGGGAAHNNMPPYVNVAMWRRTA